MATYAGYGLYAHTASVYGPVCKAVPVTTEVKQQQRKHRPAGFGSGHLRDSKVIWADCRQLLS
jgi:hypothetical protein